MTVTAQQGQVVFDCFKLALRDLINVYTGEDVEVEEGFDCNTDSNMTAIVGLSSAEMSASVAIITCQTSIQNLAEDRNLMAADWIGELCNQLAGRLKNKLCCFGVDLSMSTPTTVRGQFLSVTSTAAESFEASIHFRGGALLAQLTLNVDPDFELVESYEGCAIEEGSYEFF